MKGLCNVFQFIGLCTGNGAELVIHHNQVLLYSKPGWSFLKTNLHDFNIISTHHRRSSLRFLLFPSSLHTTNK